jgi:hypothetical protein
MPSVAKGELGVFRPQARAGVRLPSFALPTNEKRPEPGGVRGVGDGVRLIAADR